MERLVRRSNTHNSLAPLVYTAYESKCALCGWTALDGIIAPNGTAQPARGNAIHHITPVAEGGTDTEDNLILLCPNHHKQADLGIIDRETLRKATRPFAIMTEEEKAAAVAKCVDAIASAIFDE